jgi:hypothetical protein
MKHINKRLAEILPRVGGLAGALLIGIGLAGCATMPESSPALRQQAEADLVVNFQSWNAILFVKPDITGTASGVTVRPKTFTRAAVEKLLRNLKIRRELVVVVLDRRYYPDPMVAGGGMDEIQKFFEDQGFGRVAFQDAAAWSGAEGMTILRDSGAKKAE